MIWIVGILGAAGLAILAAIAWFIYDIGCGVDRIRTYVSSVEQTVTCENAVDIPTILRAIRDNTKRANKAKSKGKKARA